MLATMEGEDEEFILLLLKKGIPIDKPDKVNHIIPYLSSFKQSLTSYQPIGNKDGRTALQVAASRGLESLVRLFLSKGANLNHQDKSGKTALHYAIIEDNLSMYDTLCRLGIDQTIKDNVRKCSC